MARWLFFDHHPLITLAPLMVKSFFSAKCAIHWTRWLPIATPTSTVRLLLFERILYTIYDSIFGASNKAHFKGSVPEEPCLEPSLRCSHLDPVLAESLNPASSCRSGLAWHRIRSVWPVRPIFEDCKPNGWSWYMASPRGRGAFDSKSLSNFHGLSTCD